MAVALVYVTLHHHIDIALHGWIVLTHGHRVAITQIVVPWQNDARTLP